MEKNSLVLCINDTYIHEPVFYYIKKPIKDNIYVIRDIGTHLVKNSNRKCVLLEEITNTKSIDGYEPAFDAKRFIEIQKPMDINNIFYDILNLKK